MITGTSIKQKRVFQQKTSVIKPCGDRCLIATTHLTKLEEAIKKKEKNQKTVYGRCRGITLGWTQPHHPKSGCEAATRSHPWVRFCGLGLLVAAGSPLGAKGPSRLTPPPYQTRLLRVPSSSTETRAGVAD
jgi:hypothetical protein